MNMVVMVVVLTIMMAKMMMIVTIRMLHPQSITEMKRLAFNLVEIQAADQSVSA